MRGFRLYSLPRIQLPFQSEHCQSLLRPSRRWNSTVLATRSAEEGSQATTNIEKILLDTIKATGPVSYATYMQMCLSHPTEGYYMNPNHSVFGTKGDFITSPEISQVFGELVGVWYASRCMNTDRPVRLLELGPGRGTLMDDILRVFSHYPSTKTLLREIHLVESSPTMKAAQEAKLSPRAKENGWKIFWHTSIEDVPPSEGAFTAVLAHEFFDALPFHLLQKSESGWQEVVITSAPDLARQEIYGAPLSQLSTNPLRPPSFPSGSSPRFRPVLSQTPTAASTLLGLSSTRLQKLPVGSRVEVSPASFKIAHQIGELIHSNVENGPSGCALIIDYGDNHAFGSSFRAFKDHKLVDVFHRPGDCDLTVNVDFSYLTEALTANTTPLGLLSQAAFLTRMGIQVRVEALKRSKILSAERKQEIENAAKRLIDPTSMGSQYKVLGVLGMGHGQPSDEDRWPFIDA